MTSKMNLVVIGSGGVGKSACTIQLIQQKFIDAYDPTIQDVFNKLEVVDGRPVVLTIVDTAGQAEFTQFRSPYIRSADGVLIMYSVTDAESFRDVAVFHREVCKAKPSDACPCVIFGNKADLTRARVVDNASGVALAQSLRVNGLAATYVEGSATSLDDVQTVWHELVREVRRKRGEVAATPPPSPAGSAVNRAGVTSSRSGNGSLDASLVVPQRVGSLSSSVADDVPSQVGGASPASGTGQLGSTPPPPQTPLSSSSSSSKKEGKKKDKDGRGSSTSRCEML